MGTVAVQVVLFVTNTSTQQRYSAGKQEGVVIRDLQLHGGKELRVRVERNMLESIRILESCSINSFRN